MEEWKVVNFPTSVWGRNCANALRWHKLWTLSVRVFGSNAEHWSQFEIFQPSTLPSSPGQKGLTLNAHY
jgi:hypothetical protein